MSQPPHQGFSTPGSRNHSLYEHQQSRPSQKVEAGKMDMQGGYAPSGDFRYASHHRPEPFSSLQPLGLASQASILSSSNVTTPRQSAFSRDQMDRPPQLSLTMPQNVYASAESASSSSASSMPAQMRLSYFDSGAVTGSEMTGVGFADPSRSGTVPTTSSSAAWQQSSLHRPSYADLNTSQQGGHAGSDAGMMLPSAAFAYDSSSESNSPIRPPGYHEGSAGSFPYPGSQSYVNAYGKGALEQQHAAQHHAEISPEDIDSALNQIAAMYKSATTKKNAEFYRDKWARIWLSCNYTLKGSIQISIPRTILHESYRRACESFGIEPLQAASFGKVLRGQFADVAQRRLGGRGKTRFHYCGFGTSNEREAIKVKQLLEDEKAGRLQLSVGMSAEYAQEARVRSATLADEDVPRHFRSDAYAPLDSSAGFVASSQYGAPSASAIVGGSESQEDRMAASAFATFHSSVAASQGSGGGGGGVGTTASAYPAAASYMPRRHTLASSDANRDLILEATPSMMTPFDAAKGDGTVHGLPAASSAVDSTYNRSIRGTDSSGFPSQSTSPSLSMQGPGSRPQSMVYFRRSCRDLPDWPNTDEGDSTLSAASFHLSIKGKVAWKEYESMCQDLLQSIFHGPDMSSFERRMAAFWSSLSQDSQNALRTETTLCELILRGDAIMFRQLFVRLDDLIGDEVPDDKIGGLTMTAKSMVSRMHSLLEGRLPATFVKAKVQAAEKAAQNLERIARILESIKDFREHAMPDYATSRRYPDWANAPPSFPSSSSQVDILAPQNPGQGVGHASKPGLGLHSSALSQIQARRRDDSISSSVSDSHYTWLSGEQPYSSSNSESGYSLRSAPTADLTHGGGGMYSGLAASAARRWSGQRMRMPSGPLSRSAGTSEISGPVSSSMGGMVLGGNGGSHQGTPSDSPRGAFAEGVGTGASSNDSGLHPTFDTPQHPAPSMSVSNMASLTNKGASSSLSVYLHNPDQSQTAASDSSTAGPDRGQEQAMDQA